MALSFKPVDSMPGSQAHESRDLFAQFIASGARFAQVDGATVKDRNRLASASASFNRNSDVKVKVRARGEDTYLERVENA